MQGLQTWFGDVTVCSLITETFVNYGDVELLLVTMSVTIASAFVSDDYSVHSSDYILSRSIRPLRDNIQVS